MIHLMKTQLALRILILQRCWWVRKVNQNILVQRSFIWTISRLTFMNVFSPTWVFQQVPPCACERTPLSSSAWSRQQSSSGYRSRPFSALRMRPCLDLLWQAQLQELEKVGIWNQVRTESHLEWAILEQAPPIALTLLFGIFILLATLFLDFVPTLRLNHWLHSFLGFLRLIKGPHEGGAPSFAALLRLSCGKHWMYISMDRTKTHFG